MKNCKTGFKIEKMFGILNFLKVMDTMITNIIYFKFTLFFKGG